MKPILHSGPGLVFGVPTLGRPVPLDWALSLKALSPPINFSVLFHIVRQKEIGLARNDIAKFALEKDAKYLFFMGDDVEVPAHGLRQLIYRMEQDPEVGIVGGVYCAKARPAFPLVFRENGKGSYWDWKVGEYFEISGLGMDCTLIRTDIFKQIEEPWFKTVDTDGFLDNIQSAESWTEDLYFCKKVKEQTKYKIMCDAGVICNHWDVYNGVRYGLPSNSLPMRQKVVENAKRALLIGEEIPFSDPNFSLTTFGPEGSDYRGSSEATPFETGEFDWLIINKATRSFKNFIPEWVRILKQNGKISISFEDEFLDLEAVKKFILSYFNLSSVEINGSFLEFTV